MRLGQLGNPCSTQVRSLAAMTGTTQVPPGVDIEVLQWWFAAQKVPASTAIQVPAGCKQVLRNTSLRNTVSGGNGLLIQYPISAGCRAVGY